MVEETSLERLFQSMDKDGDGAVTQQVENRGKLLIIIKNVWFDLLVNLIRCILKQLYPMILFQLSNIFPSTLLIKTET